MGHDAACAAAADTVVVDQALIVDDASHWELLGAAHARQLVLRWHVGARTFVRALRPACRTRGDLSVAPVLPAKVFGIGCQLVARVKELLNEALIHTFAVEWPRQSSSSSTKYGLGLGVVGRRALVQHGGGMTEIIVVAPATWPQSRS